MDWLRNALSATMQQQQQRDAQRKLLQDATRPVSDSEILAKQWLDLDANAVPLDTPDGQVVNPTLRALLESPDTAQAQQQGGLAQLLGPLMQLFPAAAPTVAAGAQAGPTLANALMQQGAPQQAVQAQPAPMQNDASAIAAMLAPQQSVAKAPAQGGGFMDGLAAFFSDPANMEMIMQTGLGLASSQDFGTSLSRGWEGRRNVQQQQAAKVAQEKNSKLAAAQMAIEADKTIAETGKLGAETKKLLKEAESAGEGMLDENDYIKVYSDMQKHVSSDIFRQASAADDPLAGFLDNETYARYLVNSGLKPENRRYGPMKADYVDQMASLTGQVQSGEMKASALESRIDEYVVAFGPQATSQMLRELRGIQ